MSGSISIVADEGQAAHRTLKLEGDINVFLAAELHRCCVEISQGAASVAVDCQQVASLDIAAIQLMVALNDTLVAHGGTFGVSGLSQDVMETVHLAGLGQRLGLGSGLAAEGATA